MTKVKSCHKNSVKITWDTKPKRSPKPRHIELQVVEIVVPYNSRASHF